MKTSTHTRNSSNLRFLSLMMIVLAVLALAYAYVSRQLQNSLNVPVVTAPESDFLQASAVLVHTDEDVPLAREELVRTAIAGVGGGTSPPQPEDELQRKISSRETDGAMQSFLRQTSLQQLSSVYLEICQMIDTRHVNPPSYEERTRGAIHSVMTALRNEEFWRMNNVRPNAQALAGVESQLQQIAGTQPARDANSAVATMQMTAEIVSRGLGVRREAAALEFLNGTLDSLDKYSAFMPETAGSRPGALLDSVRTAGLEENVVGIGVELKANSQGVEIVSVVENSPSSELGLREGDVIVAIDQQPMGGKTLNEVADRLVGQAGSRVTVDVVRNGQRFRGTLTRRQFYVSSVSGTKLVDTQSRLGYVRLKQFSSSTAEDLEKALWSLHNQGMQGLVVDLRGNPGGLLDECVDVSDMFLPTGVIVSTRGRTASDNTQETARQDKTWAVPMVVLVDENSASASEIFAAAIQENLRGVIIGRTSYGKGTVQTHFPMRTVSATLKLTTAKFYSPRGREMAGAGVTPDVPVTLANGNAGTRGTMNDADMQMAMQVFREGTPTNLAARFGGASTNPFGQIPNLTNNWPTQPNGTLPYGNDPYGTRPFGGQPYGNPQYSNPQYGNPYPAAQPGYHSPWQATDRGIVEY